MIVVLQILSLMLVVFSLLSCGYHLCLLVVHFFQRRRPLQPTEKRNGKNLKIAVVIPAHNEQECIRATLHSCKQLTYPPGDYEIIVIADNCHDDTAEIVRGEHVRILERVDESKQGKGYALAFAFSHLLKESFDAFLVLDADCILENDALQIMNHSLEKGDGAVQLNYVVANPDDSSMTYALAVGNFIENTLFYSPKSHLGWAVMLRGTGMLLTREVLENLPWQAFSQVEDVEYGITLLRQGYRVRFLEQARVLSPFPVDTRQLQVQRTRWASGNLAFSRKEALSAIFQGIRQRNWLLLDGGITFLVLSKPLLLLGTVGAVLVSSLSYSLSQSLMSSALLFAALLGLSGYLVYFAVGVIGFGLSRSRLKLLLCTPKTVVQLIIIAARGLFAETDSRWKRTPR